MHTLLSHSFSESDNRSYQLNKQITFQMLFNNLEEFLTEQTKEKPEIYPNKEDVTSSGHEMLKKAKAKEYFINSAHEIIVVLRKQLEADGIFQYLPMSHLDKIIMNTKQELTKSYAAIIESIENNKIISPESDSTGSKPEEGNDESVATTVRKGKRGKNKIPKRALLILKNWLTEHFNPLTTGWPL